MWGVKLFGDDMEILNREANKISQKINSISGATAVNVEQTSGLPLLNVEVDKSRAAQYRLVGKSNSGYMVATSVGGQNVEQFTGRQAF